MSRRSCEAMKQLLNSSKSVKRRENHESAMLTDGAEKVLAPHARSICCWCCSHAAARKAVNYTTINCERQRSCGRTAPKTCLRALHIIGPAILRFARKYMARSRSRHCNIVFTCIRNVSKAFLASCEAATEMTLGAGTALCDRKYSRCIEQPQQIYQRLLLWCFLLR